MEVLRIPLIVDGIARYLNYRDLLNFARLDPEITRQLDQRLRILEKAQAVGYTWYLASRPFHLGDQYYDTSRQTLYHYTLVPGSAFRRQWLEVLPLP